MTWDQIEANWAQLSNKVRGTWGKLTDEDYQHIKGQRDLLLAAIQNRYGISKDEAERELDAFERSLEAATKH
jgi:uncharacterized protein YjbJ (UPF0337 family)